MPCPLIGSDLEFGIRVIGLGLGIGLNTISISEDDVGSQQVQNFGEFQPAWKIQEKAKELSRFLLMVVDDY